MIRARITAFAVSLVVLFSSVICFSQLTPVPALALSGPVTQFAATSNCNGASVSFFGFQPWYAYICNNQGEPQITKLSDIWLIVLPIVGDGVTLAGYLAAIFILWGGIKYVKSRGNPSETAAAQATILNAVVGLVLAII